MPIFLDTHHGSELPLDSIRDFLRAARSATPIGSGVRPIDLYCGDAGRVSYVLAAADEATVRAQHADQGVICWRVRPVDISLAADADQFSQADKLVVRRMIAAEHAWSATPGDPALPVPQIREPLA